MYKQNFASVKKTENKSPFKNRVMQKQKSRGEELKNCLGDVFCYNSQRIVKQWKGSSNLIPAGTVLIRAWFCLIIFSVQRNSKILLVSVSLYIQILLSENQVYFL